MKHLIYALIATVALGHMVVTHTMHAEENFEDVIYEGMVWFYQMLSEAVAQPLTQAELKAKWIAWDMLCFELRDVDCSGISAPKVKTFRPNPLRPGLAGYYDGSDTIFIRNNIRGPNREEVLAHEMSHWVDVQLGITNVPGFAREICFSEKRAWSVSDNYWIKYGWANKAVGASWTNWYRHCTPYQAELYPDVYGE